MLTGALAFELPFGIANLFAPTTPRTTIKGQLEDVPSTTPRIAIIGAGAGGSSAAFWLSKARTRIGVNFEIDVYESRGYVGGRECPSFKHKGRLIEENFRKYRCIPL